MGNDAFRFKQFNVSHKRSSMKVGVDSVLIGSWARIKRGKVLDVGTGCGLISLMVAQRDPFCRIEAIDIHKDSVEESKENFISSVWRGRINSRLIAFENLIIECGGNVYDTIVSNPPFYKAGVKNFDTSRMVARHQGELAPLPLIEGASKLLKCGGVLSFILPYSLFKDLPIFSVDKSLIMSRVCNVKSKENSCYKRCLVEYIKLFPDKKYIGINKSFSNVIRNVEVSSLTLFEYDGSPTNEYRQLCKDFYLKF